MCLWKRRKKKRKKPLKNPDSKTVDEKEASGSGDAQVSGDDQENKVDKDEQISCQKEAEEETNNT